MKAYWQKGMDDAIYRNQMMAYKIVDDLEVAFGISKANLQFGSDGLPQFFISDFNDILESDVIKKVESNAIDLHNIKMPKAEYREIMDSIAKH